MDETRPFVQIVADGEAWVNAVNDGVPTPEVPGVSATGACLCTSFSRDVRTDECRVCGHVSHASRVHCGVMVHA